MLHRSTLLVAASYLLALHAIAAPIQYQVTVNPIQVCDDFGLNCGNPTRELYLAETDKLWAQAGIDIKFLDWRQVNNTSLPTGERGQLSPSQIMTTRNHVRAVSLAFSIPGDINRNGVVDRVDLDLFMQGWRYQQHDPGLDTWLKGDFNHDGVTNFADAYILRTALAGNSAALSEIDSVFGAAVPEPAAGIVLAVALLAGLSVRRLFHSSALSPTRRVSAI